MNGKELWYRLQADLLALRRAPESEKARVGRLVVIRARMARAGLPVPSWEMAEIMDRAGPWEGGYL